MRPVSLAGFDRPRFAGTVGVRHVIVGGTSSDYHPTSDIRAGDRLLRSGRDTVTVPLG